MSKKRNILQSFDDLVNEKVQPPNFNETYTSARVIVSKIILKHILYNKNEDFNDK